MTISTTTTKVIYSPGGTETNFTVVYPFFAAADLEVIERVIATGVETVQVLNTDYTVTGGGGSTGTVIATTAPPATVQWVIRRKTPLTQEIDYVENDPFPAAVHEEGLDRGVMRLQERIEELARALKFPVSDAAALSSEVPNSVTRASKFLGFDTAGVPIASPGSVDTLAVSAFMATVLDDATAAAARATLGAAGLVSPVFTTPEINDTSADHQYIFAVAELAADRTISLPLLLANDTFVFAAFAQLLTKKTLKDYGETVNAIGSIGGGTQDIDLTLGNVVTGTVDTSATTFTFSNPPASGTAGSFTLKLTNGGSQTVTWPASVDWPGGAAPTLIAAGVDVLTFFTTDGGTIWYGFPAGLDMK